MKDNLYWNNLHNTLRIAQGIPQPIPVYPNENSTSQNIMDFTTNTIFHVSNQSDKKEYIHIFASSPVECTVFVRILSSSILQANGTKTRITSWPSTVDALTFKIRSNQPSPLPILQGYAIGNGAAVSLMTTTAGATAFGFIVKE
jgi:hypothetical protein